MSLSSGLSFLHILHPNERIGNLRAQQIRMPASDVQQAVIGCQQNSSFEITMILPGRSFGRAVRTLGVWPRLRLI